MNREAIAKLRLDSRLTRRRGWIGESELARELSGLPDVSHKGTTLGEVADGSPRRAATSTSRSRGCCRACSTRCA